MTITKLFFLVLPLLLLISCSKEQDINNNGTFTPIKKTIFHTQTLFNKNFSISNINNKVILQDNNKDYLFLIFFTTTCSACTAEISVLNHLNNKYKNIKFLSLVLDSDDRDSLSFFKTTHKINYPISYTLLENEDLFVSITHSRSVPFMILYDKKGNYLTHYNSAVVEEMIDIDFRTLTK